MLVNKAGYGFQGSGKLGGIVMVDSYGQTSIRSTPTRNHGPGKEHMFDNYDRIASQSGRMQAFNQCINNYNNLNNIRQQNWKDWAASTSFLFRGKPALYYTGREAYIAVNQPRYLYVGPEAVIPDPVPYNPWDEPTNWYFESTTFSQEPFLKMLGDVLIEDPPIHLHENSYIVIKCSRPTTENRTTKNPGQPFFASVAVKCGNDGHQYLELDFSSITELYDYKFVFASLFTLWGDGRRTDSQSYTFPVSKP